MVSGDYGAQAETTDKSVEFSRYDADDVIIHHKSKVNAAQILQLEHQRMELVGLELHPQKTKIVYCRDHRRKGKHPKVKFDFLGYSFQPRTTFSKKMGKYTQGIIDWCVNIGFERIGRANCLTLKEYTNRLEKVCKSVKRHSKFGVRTYYEFVRNYV